jgi:hypothetical protein
MNILKIASMWNIPWLAVALPFVVLTLVLAASWLVKRRRNGASLAWPMVGAKFEAGSVSGGDVDSRLDLIFSYMVSGKEYRGHFTETSVLRGNYEDLLKSFKQGPLYVRYNPSDPSDYLMNPYRDMRNT